MATIDQWRAEEVLA